MIYIILACLLYTLAILFATFASRNADTNAVSLITNAVSVLLPLLIVLPRIIKRSSLGQGRGLWMAAVTGLIIGGYVMSLNKAYSFNKIGIVTPIVFGGAIFLSTILSYFIYQEAISTVEALGLALVLVGVAVIIYARATT